MDPLLPDEEHGGLVEDSDDEVTPESTEVFDPNEMEEQEEGVNSPVVHEGSENNEGEV